MSGICYLAGAGPGDPGLVTLKARKCIEEADVLVYDALSSAELLTWVKPGCEKIDVGKRASNHKLPHSSTFCHRIWTQISRTNLPDLSSPFRLASFH